MSGLFPLKPLQQRALDMLRDSIRSGHKRPILQAATGFGKTVLAAHIISGARAKGKRVAITLPRLSLIDQTVERLVQNGIDPNEIGVMQADHPARNDYAPIQVCSVQTLGRRGYPQQCDVCIVDECHIRFDGLDDWIVSNPNQLFIGLSATPWTKGLGLIWNDLVIPSSMQELINEGYLCKFKAFAPTHVDLEGIKTIGGDYHEGQLSERMRQPRLTADIVHTWCERGDNRPTLLFAVDRAHADILQRQFEAVGVASAYVDAFTSRDARNSIGRDFQEGRTKVICSVGTMTTGVDLDVRCISFCRPTKSEILLVQALGRGLRATPSDKTDCIAEGSLVLTDCGPVPIERVTLTHKLWDGVNWVSHGGAICKGKQNVIGYSGIIGTPDHEVFTDYGWISLSEAAYRRIRIAQTGRDGQAIRLSEDCFQRSSLESNPKWLQNSNGRDRMRHVWAPHLNKLLEYCQRALVWLPGLQSTASGSQVARGKTGKFKRSLHEFAQSSLLGLWRSRNRIQVQFPNGRGDLDHGEFGIGPLERYRSNQQRWALRARKPATFYQGSEFVEYKETPKQREDARFSDSVSSSQVCEQHLSEFDIYGTFGPRDSEEVGYTIFKAKRRVWDILNAGPLHRFTVSGRLVHNCLIFDHSDSLLRLGLPTDIAHSELDRRTAGSRCNYVAAERERLPTECKECQFLIPSGLSACPQCGWIKRKHSMIFCEEGELEELTAKERRAKKTNRESSQEEKIGFYSELRGYAHESGYKDGWAARKYRERFGVWPNMVRGSNADFCGPATRAWITKTQRDWARRKTYAEQAYMKRVSTEMANAQG